MIGILYKAYQKSNKRYVYKYKEKFYTYDYYNDEENFWFELSFDDILDTIFDFIIINGKDQWEVQYLLYHLYKNNFKLDKDELNLINKWMN